MSENELLKKSIIIMQNGTTRIIYTLISRDILDLQNQGLRVTARGTRFYISTIDCKNWFIICISPVKKIYICQIPAYNTRSSNMREYIQNIDSCKT